MDYNWENMAPNIDMVYIYIDFLMFYFSSPRVIRCSGKPWESMLINYSIRACYMAATSIHSVKDRSVNYSSV